MEVLILSRWRWAAAFLAFAVFALPHGAMAQGLKATIFLKDPPAGNPPAYTSTTPIAIGLQVESGSRVITTDGFSRTEFFRQLFFTLPGGGTLSDPAAIIHRTVQPLQCFSPSLNQDIPVVPVEILAESSRFFLEYSLADARTFYNDLVQSGVYSVNARIPVLTFASDAAIITDCVQFPGTRVVNVGQGGGTEVTIPSNSVQFCVNCVKFVGFAPPVGTESACSASPCLTANFGNTVPFKFQLFDSSGAVVSTAIATISAQKFPVGSPLQGVDFGQGSIPTNQFKFDPTGQQYVFNLDTSVLVPGVWKISASIDIDGSVHSVLLGLK